MVMVENLEIVKGGNYLDKFEYVNIDFFFNCSKNLVKSFSSVELSEIDIVFFGDV